MKHFILKPSRQRFCTVVSILIMHCVPVNAALEPIQTAGTINRSFNPEGFMITSSGARVTGAEFFSGSLVVDLGGDEGGISLDINQSNGTIVSVFPTDIGPQPPGGDRCGLTVTKQDGTLDTSFNPSGLWITDDGTTVIGGYSGTLIISQSPNNNRDIIPHDVVVDQDTGNIIFVSELAFPGNANRDILLTVVKPDGTIDSSFNPLAQRLSDDGSYAGTSPFSGVMDLNAVNLRNYVPAVAYDHIRKKVVIAFQAADTNDAAIIVLNPTGANPVDRSFNPSGLSVASDGSYLTGGYSGLLRIDLGGASRNPSVAVDQDTGKIIVATQVETGPGVLDNVGIIVANPTGHVLLDSSFNPSGDWMQSDGTLVPGGYSGALIADIGGNESELAVAFDQELQTIVVAARTSTGLINRTNFAILSVTATGTRNVNFNPSGIEVDTDGSTQLSGIPGRLVISYTDNVDVVSVAVDAARNRIVASTEYSFGAGGSIAVFGLSRTDAMVLEQGFNPQALLINQNGQTSQSPTVYTGLFRAVLANDSVGNDVGVYVEDGTIIAGTSRGSSPNDLQLFSINGVTRFPPPPPLSDLYQLPYIVMGAA